MLLWTYLGLKPKTRNAINFRNSQFPVLNWVGSVLFHALKLSPRYIFRLWSNSPVRSKTFQASHSEVSRQVDFLLHVLRSNVLKVVNAPFSKYFTMITIKEIQRYFINIWIQIIWLCFKLKFQVVFWWRLQWFSTHLTLTILNKFIAIFINVISFRSKRCIERGVEFLFLCANSINQPNQCRRSENFKCMSCGQNYSQ